MAAIKFLDAAGKYKDDRALDDVIGYICYPDKTPHHIIGGEQIDLHDIADSMRAVSLHYKKNCGKRLLHFVVIFTAKELSDICLAKLIASEIASYIGTKFQVVYALHEDTGHPHIHFVLNRISYVDGYRYSGKHWEYYSIIDHIRKILYNFGIKNFQVWK